MPLLINYPKAITAYEHKDPNWVAKYLEPGLKAQIFSLGTISGVENLEALTAWEYQATEGGQVNMV